MHYWCIVHLLTGDAAETINPLRERFDPETARVISAHLTLSGTFASPHPAHHYTDTIQSIANRLHPFNIALDGFSTFLPMSNTNFARLAVPDKAIAVHDAIISQFPWKEGFPYYPHVTITEYLNEADTISVSKLLSTIDIDVSDTVTKLSLVEKDVDDIWRVVQEFALSEL